MPRIVVSNRLNLLIHTVLLWMLMTVTVSASDFDDQWGEWATPLDSQERASLQALDNSDLTDYEAFHEQPMAEEPGLLMQLEMLERQHLVETQALDLQDAVTVVVETGMPDYEGTAANSNTAGSLLQEHLQDKESDGISLDKTGDVISLPVLEHHGTDTDEMGFEILENGTMILPAGAYDDSFDPSDSTDLSDFPELIQGEDSTVIDLMQEFDSEAFNGDVIQ